MTNRTPSAIPLVLSAAVWASACALGAGGDAGPAFTVRDSAGIEIADVAHPSWSEGEAWTVDAGPVLTIGAMEGDEAYQLYRVMRALRLADGSIVIANGGTQQLRWFDADGRHVRDAGGTGEGPGEFDSLFGVSLVGDVLVAHDFRFARVTRFDTAGALLGTVQLDRGPGLPIEIWPTDGGYIGMIQEVASDVTHEATYHRRNVVYVRYAADGALIDTVAVMPGPEMLMSGGPVNGGFVMTMASPLIAHNSEQVVVGSRLVAGITDRFEIRVFGRDGALARLIRDPSRDLPVTAEEWDAVVAEEMADAETPNERRAVQDRAERKPAPEMRPAFDRFVADRMGYLWVAPYRPTAGRPVPWLVIDIGGGPLGAVDLPEGLRPMDIGEDYVLGVIRDDLDVEQVRMYPLHRSH